MNNSSKMTIVVDNEQFDRNEKFFMRELVESIRDDLKKIGIPKSKLPDATYKLAFSVVVTLDNCAGMTDSEDRPCSPVLTFEAAPFDYTTLIARPDGTYMHEYVADIVAEVFGKKKA